ncbi:MAG: amidohydrolase [Gemmatimonadetes bacterium]|nr:amidohydrolase [Gemmatimonadota bacterium]
MTFPDLSSAPARRVRGGIRFAGLALVVALSAAACRTADAPPITLAVVNARVWTGDSTAPWAEAVAIADDRIVAVGTTADIRAQAGSARIVDAAGGLVTPGFIDSHVHFTDGGFALASVKLRDANSKAEFIRRIGDFAKTLPKGTWIRSGDWDHTLWGGELPTHDWIDSVTPDNPVWINRLDGHMNLANALAMRAAGVDRTTRDVAGGSIVRDAAGNPTGVFKDNAMGLVDRAQPARSAAEADIALDSAMGYVAARGVTSVHHMGGFGDVATFRRAHAAGRLRTRIVAQVPLSQWAALRDSVQAHGRGDVWLRIGGLKGFVDGSLGSHTAAMLAPFTDAPTDSGLFVTPPDSLYAWTKGADAAGLQVMVHAIGDKAIRTQLDIFERVAKEHGPRDRRFRIEHAQHIAPADIPRFGALGVLPSMQPYHEADDGRWAERVIGPERSQGTYAFRALLDSGARLAFGSDWFVAPPTPLEGIKAAVTRQTLDGKHPDGWVPAQKISVEDALRAYTRGAAYAGFQDRDVGMLRAGMLADLVLLDRDITSVAPETIDQAQVKLTVVGGKVVYEKK